MTRGPDSQLESRWRLQTRKPAPGGQARRAVSIAGRPRPWQLRSARARAGVGCPGHDGTRHRSRQPEGVQVSSMGLKASRRGSPRRRICIEEDCSRHRATVSPPALGFSLNSARPRGGEAPRWAPQAPRRDSSPSTEQGATRVSGRVRWVAPATGCQPASPQNQHPRTQRRKECSSDFIPSKRDIRVGHPGRSQLSLESRLSMKHGASLLLP
jgi:hypothetical protein